MDKETGKPWERPWTTDEIREHSSNWNLAGDSGLLHHLQQFSQNLLTKTHATEVALDKLTEDLKATSNSVQNATNTFLFLANTQFVENRVYDDDEKETPPEEKKDVNPPKSKEEQEAEVFQNVKKALDMGLALLDTHFETVEVPASDSEEEESSASVGRLVLKPKNPYISRPLPYLIGSKEFMEDDKVGLGELSSDTEESPDQNVAQSSGSDDEMEHDELLISSKRPVALSSTEAENCESESDHSGTVVKQKKLRTSSLMAAIGDEEDEGNMFGRESTPPEADEVEGIMKNAFSDELSTKLASTKPQTSLKKENENDNMFVPSSELDDDDDTGLFGRPRRSFTERQGLFDDLDDWKSTSDSLWNDNNSSIKPSTDSVKKDPQSQNIVNTSHNSEILTGNQDEDIFSTPKQKQNIQANTVQEGKIKESTPKSFLSSKAEGALFGQNDESDDLFSEKPKVTGAATSNSTLFGKDELEEDDLFAVPTSTVDSKSGASQNEVKKKKPPGAVRVFSDLGLFDNSSPVRRNSGEEKNAAERKMGSDDSVLHQDHSSAIDGGSSDQAPQKEGWESRENKSSEISSLNDSKLFQGLISSTKRSDLGASNSPLFKTEVDGGSLFDKQRFSEPGSLDQNIFGSKTSATTSSAPSNLKPKLKKPVSLFDDSDSGDDELLFSSTSSTSSRSRRSQGSGDFLGSSVERRILPKKGLFEDNLLFGTGNKDEPEVDIFTSQSESKAKGDSLTQDNSFSGNGGSCDTSISSKKTVSNIFDDIDEVDDIFAVPKITVENTQSHSVKNADTGLGKFSLFSDDSGEVNDIFSSKIIENEKNDGFMSGQEQSQSVVPDIDSVTNYRGAESSLVGEDSSIPLPLGIENEVENATKVKKNTKPTISQKPKVPTKPAPSLLSSQGYPNSMQSTFPPQIESNIESSTNISVNDTKFEVTEKVNNVTTNTQGQKSSNNIGGEKVSESVTPVPSVKPEPPRTLNIRKTTDIVFENTSNDDDLFESWSKKSSMGTDNVIKEQPTRKVLSNVLDSYGSNATSSVSRDNNSLDFSRKHVPTVGISPSDIAESQKTALSPSKLYIDPRTLLPGAKPPSLSLATDGAVGFDRPAETATMLHSAGKERVKIQVKRRPQTRKARQEALRASSIEYDSIDAALISQISNSKTDSVQNNVVSSSASNSSPLKASAPKVFEPNSERKSPTAEKSVISVSKASPKSEDHSSVSESEQLLPKTDALKNIVSDCLSGNSNALSPLTDEEDLFAVPHELPFDDSSNKEMPNDDKNLFGGAPVISPLGEKTGSDSFSSQSALNIEREQDVSLPGKETSDLQETRERAKSNGNPIAGPIGSEISGSSPLVDKNSRNISSISDTEDIFTELPNSKWLGQDDVGANEKRGLFDDEKGNDEERYDDDDDDDDLFLSVKKRGKIGKKSVNDVSTEAASRKSPLFLPDFYNALESTTKDNKERKQSSSEELVPASMEDKVSLQKDSDILFPPVKSVNKSVSSNHKENIGSSELFFQSISDSSQTVESDDLFASNISTEDVRTDSAAKITHKVVASVSQEKTKSRVESLFGDDSIESDDLFGSSSVPKMPGSGSTRNFITGSKTKDTKGLFDDGDDDDIFTLGLNKSKGPKSETLFSKEDGSQSSGKEADDLFSKRNMNSKNQGAKHSSTQKVQSFEDPLMGFNK